MPQETAIVLRKSHERSHFTVSTISAPQNETIASKETIKDVGAPSRTLSQWAWAAAKRLWVPFDFAGAGVSVLLAYMIGPAGVDPTITERPLTVTVIHASAFVLILYLSGLYDRNTLNRPLSMFIRSSFAAGLATLLTLASMYFLFYQPIGRWVAAIVFLLSLAASMAPRMGIWWILRRRRRRILIVGRSPLAEQVASALSKDFSGIYKVVPASTVEEARERVVDEIILPMDFHPMEQSIGPAVRCVSMGCQVRTIADLYEDLFRRVPVSSEVTLTWLLNFGWDSTNHLKSSIKRVSDIGLAAIALLLSSPVWLIVPALIKLTSHGPVFYTQTRVGQYERRFKILKFRTMPVDAESAGAVWSAMNDPRPNLLGKILRKSRIDEIPQLVTILRGHMSFVGPRPERPEFTEKLESDIPFYAFRHLVRPGLTGWAQISYRYGASVEEARRKLEYDLYYVRHYSLLRDFGIVLRTITSVMKGAR